MGPAPAQANKPQDPQRYLAQGEKLGGTPFVSQGGEIQGDAWAFLPVRRSTNCAARLWKPGSLFAPS